MSEEILLEFKKIIKEEYRLEISDKESSLYAESLIKYFALLELMYFESINE